MSQETYDDFDPTGEKANALEQRLSKIIKGKTMSEWDIVERLKLAIEEMVRASAGASNAEGGFRAKEAKIEWAAFDAAHMSAKADVELLAAEITRLRSLVDWRAIESAPKDGTEILAVSETGGTGVMMVRHIALQDFITTSEAEEYANQGMDASSLEEPDWFHADFVHGDRLSPDCYPTHWLPLPPPPKEKT